MSNQNSERGCKMPCGCEMAMPQQYNQMPYASELVHFESAMTMPYQCNQMPYNNMMTMPQCNAVLPQYGCPVQQANYPVMPVQQLYYQDETEFEQLYPQTYKIVKPVVKKYCDRLECVYGITKEQIDELSEKISKDVESEVDAQVKQFGSGGRYILNELIAIVLISELLKRR